MKTIFWLKNREFELKLLEKLCEGEERFEDIFRIVLFLKSLNFLAKLVAEEGLEPPTRGL